MRRLAGIAVLSMSGLALVGCSTTWDADTTFQFSDLPKNRSFAMKAVFNEHDLVSELLEDEEITTFRVRGIASTRELGSVLRDVRAVARDLGVSAPLEKATLQFGELSASGRVFTTVEVEVSPGSTVYVADGDPDSPWRRVDAKNGVFRGTVNTSRAVAVADGWLYIIATRESGRTFSRVNVLSGEFEPRITETPFPNPSALR